MTDLPRRYHLIVGGGEVEAIELTPGNLDKAISWVGGAGVGVVEIDPFDDTLRYVAINLMTIDGIVRVSQGHFVIKDALGNVTAMGPNEFNEKYVLNDG